MSSVSERLSIILQRKELALAVAKEQEKGTSESTFELKARLQEQQKQQKPVDGDRPVLRSLSVKKLANGALKRRMTDKKDELQVLIDTPSTTYANKPETPVTPLLTASSKMISPAPEELNNMPRSAIKEEAIQKQLKEWFQPESDEDAVELETAKICEIEHFPFIQEQPVIVEGESDDEDKEYPLNQNEPKHTQLSKDQHKNRNAFRLTRSNTSPTPPKRKLVLDAFAIQHVKRGLTKERHLFLFSDVLVLCRPTSDGQFVIKNIIPFKDIRKYEVSGQEDCMDSSILNQITLDNLEAFLDSGNSSLMSLLHTHPTLAPFDVLKVLLDSKDKRSVSEYIRALPIVNRPFLASFNFFLSIFGDKLLCQNGFLLDFFVLSWMQFNLIENKTFATLKEKALQLIEEYQKQRAYEKEADKKLVDKFKMKWKRKQTMSSTKQALPASSQQQQRRFFVDFELSIEKVNDNQFEGRLICLETLEKKDAVTIEPLGNWMTCTPSSMTFTQTQKMHRFKLDLKEAQGPYLLFFSSATAHSIKPVFLQNKNTDNLFTFIAKTKDTEKSALCKKYMVKFKDTLEKKSNEVFQNWTFEFNQLFTQKHGLNTLNDSDVLKDRIVSKEELVFLMCGEE